MIKSYLIALLILAALSITSLFIGVIDLSTEPDQWHLLTLSRIPRTVAVILTGMSISIAGVIMQMLARNKFVEPSTTGTVEWATLGILLLTIYWPESPMWIKLVIACLFSFVGACSFLLILKRITLQSTIIVPLAGIMYAGIISSIVLFIAYQYDLVQSIWTWIQGDFSMMLQGRYELLWLGAFLAVLAYITADQFTLAGLGQSVATNLGLNYRIVFLWGITLVAFISGITVVIAGVLPFLGLVVPNLVSLTMGDNLRQSLPWIAIVGASLVLFCDILARIINFPYEIPIGTVMGIIGSGLFLYLILRKQKNG
jgi:iron complex transport system permease protein